MGQRNFKGIVFVGRARLVFSEANIHIPTCMSDSFKEIHAAGPMRHFGLIIHHVCEQLVNGEAKGDCPPWWYLLSRVVRVRLTNLIATRTLECRQIRKKRKIESFICISSSIKLFNT